MKKALSVSALIIFLLTCRSGHSRTDEVRLQGSEAAPLYELLRDYKMLDGIHSPQTAASKNWRYAIVLSCGLIPDSVLFTPLLCSFEHIGIVHSTTLLRNDQSKKLLEVLAEYNVKLIKNGLILRIFANDVRASADYRLSFVDESNK